MPGCGCTGAGAGGGCAFANTGLVQFAGSCASGITGDVDGAAVLDDVTSGVFDQCAPFEITVKQGGSWRRVTIPSLRCASIM